MNIQYEIMQSILCNLNNMNTNNMCMNKPFIALISVNVRINNTLQQKSTIFFYFTIQFQLLDTQKKVIIFKSSSGNGSQISVLTELHLTRKIETSIQFKEIYYFLSGY